RGGRAGGREVGEAPREAGGGPARGRAAGRGGGWQAGSGRGPSYPRRCPGRLRGEGLLGLPAAVPRAGRDPWAAVPRGRGGGGPRCRAAKGSPTNARARVYARVREERPKGRRLTRVPARIMRAPACTRARGTAKGSPTNAHARALCAYARACVGEAPHHEKCL